MLFLVLILRLINIKVWLVKGILCIYGMWQILAGCVETYLRRIHVGLLWAGLGGAMPAISKREQIITEALLLFYQNGFDATGVDRIITEVGVSKKTYTIIFDLRASWY